MEVTKSQQIVLNLLDKIFDNPKIIKQIVNEQGEVITFLQEGEVFYSHTITKRGKQLTTKMI